MMLKRSLSLTDCQIKVAQGTFEGYAAVFGGKDSYGDTIARGAFSTTLKRDGKPKMFLNHDSWSLPIGKWTKAVEDDHGLQVAGELTPGQSTASDVEAALKHGTIDGLSIGFFLKSGDYEELADGGRLITKVSQLVEVSVVTFPADSAARIDQASIKAEEIEAISTIREFELCLRDAGITRSLAVALVKRAKTLFAQGEPGGKPDVKALGEVETMIRAFAERNAARFTL